MSDSSWKLETGSAPTLALIALAVFGLAFTGLGIGFQLARAELRTQLIADLVATSASDSVVGIIAGLGCENAEEIAIRNGAQMLSCRIVSSVASVRVGNSHSLVKFTKEAKARPYGG